MNRSLCGALEEGDHLVQGERNLSYGCRKREPKLRDASRIVTRLSLSDGYEAMSGVVRSFQVTLSLRLIFVILQ